ncbi:hypothetical protein BMS3Bbin10_01254 [bacterium BMS3Bbin10]|nr:hypothetical protein BMS3Bbin10_01254 [bacterium BMS3Bbin10]
MPLKVANAATSAGRAVHIFALRGAAEPEIENFSHTWINFGHIGKILSVSKAENCGEMVIVGSARRPRLADLRIDFGALWSLPSLLGLMAGGDNSVLTGIIEFFESKGFKVLGAHEIAPELMAGKGVFSRRRPGKADRKDIAIGLEVIAALGALDVGQATVVAQQYVLAVEAAEGTDRMLQRCKDLNKWGKSGSRKRSGVLVKCAKPGQERRIDLPTVGPETIRHASKAGLAGIAIAANEVLIVDREQFIKAADDAGLFVIGVDMQDGKPA